MSRRKRDAGEAPATHTAPRMVAAGSQPASAAGGLVAKAEDDTRTATECRRSIVTGLLLPIGAAVAWWLALVAMAIFTANPITLNRDQILRADFVVTGTVDETQPHTLIVDKEWKKKAGLRQVTVENLDETGARPGRTYLVPLSKDVNGRYFVTETKDERLLIYPAEDEAVEQLEAILP